jgi:NAD+ dependent glucose-6-phosphate dehydrogenase
MDMTDYAAVLRAMQGMEAVAHLSADPKPSAPWESILSNNLIGAYNAYEAAREAGVRRLIFASSNHAVGYPWPRTASSAPMRPSAPIASTA